MFYKNSFIVFIKPGFLKLPLLNKLLKKTNHISTLILI